MDGVHARLAEGPHAELAAGVAELVERGLGDDHIAEGIVHDEELCT